MKRACGCSVDWNHGNNYVASGAGDNCIALLRAERDGAGGLSLALANKYPTAHAGDVNCVRCGQRMGLV
jgi:hypothetical protein